MRAVVCGANGAMGQLICAALGEAPVGKVSVDGENGACKHFSELPDVKPEVVIDFSHHSAVADVLRYALAQNCAAVIGTTGHTEEEKQLIHDAARKIPVFFSGNMSLGIAVLCRLAAQAAAAFPEADIEILEIHHNRKVDAPSGTAHMLFRAVKQVRPTPWSTAAVPGSASGQRRKSAFPLCAWATLWVSMRSTSAPPARP